MASDKHAHDYKETSRVTDIRAGKGIRTTVTYKCARGLTNTEQE